MREYNNVWDNIKQVILDNRIREDEQRIMMKSKDVLDDNTLYTKSFSLNAPLKHDQHPDISYAFKAKTSPNIFDKDEITLTQAKKIETVDYKDIPAEMHNKIYPLLILLKRKRNQFQEITKQKCRLVMDR